MKEFVLITGASGGIGLELAKKLAAKSYNLIIVARNSDKLTAIKQQLMDTYAVSVYVFACDLSKVENAITLYENIVALNLQVAMLVNNAGVGVYGEFTETALSHELAMIELNVSSLVALTKLFAFDMKKRGKGKIMNIASLLSFLPFPYFSVYSATKAFVLAFSETIAAELEDSGVVVTTLCPGPVATDFGTADMLRTNGYKTNKPIAPEIVAGQGVKLLLNGKGKKIVGLGNWFIANLPRITPDFLMMKIKKNLGNIKLKL